MSKGSNYCEIDITSKESYSGMRTNGAISLKSKYSDDTTSLDNVIQCQESKSTETKPRWEMALELEPKRRS